MPGCLDMVFIDADHKYEIVIADIRAWLPKVKPGGILCGHDYRRPGDDVNRAVDELLGSDRIKLLGRSAIWWLRLPT
jgi:predicted O-methyltransferase YrrM